MKSVIRFEQQFDVPRLRHDLETAERLADSHLHFNTKDHDGGWSAIALVSAGGREDAEAIRHLPGVYKSTPVMAECPYFRQIIDTFACQKKRVRLLRLAPGTEIFDHSDGFHFSWASGYIARMHIPIVTHEDVEFFVEGRRVIMKPGELWYCDVSRRHRVANRSEIGRVHLVIDLVIDPWVRAMFPPESVGERLGNLASRWYHWLKSTVARRARRVWSRA